MLCLKKTRLEREIDYDFQWLQFEQPRPLKTYLPGYDLPKKSSWNPYCDNYTRRQRLADVFRNRLMFPIMDIRAVLRFVEEPSRRPAQVHNSPSPHLRQERQPVWNQLAGQSIRKEDMPVAGRGYMDVSWSPVRFFQRSCPMRTAVTDKQMNILRNCPRTWCSRDSDAAEKSYAALCRNM